jgi:arylsulfatase A-like enzyme
LVSDLFDYLKMKNILDESIVIITSDHGESLGDHNHLDHYYVLYEALLKVPFMIRFPQLFPKGMRENSMVQTLDILPTLKEVLGLTDTGLKEMQGIPLPPLKNGSIPSRDFSISERYQDLKGLKKSYPGMELSHLERFELDRKTAIRTDKYKLISSLNYDSELFDLENDPTEEKNILNEKKEIADQLQKKIDEWRKSFTAAKIENKEAEFDDAIRKRLESLGYLG